MRCTTAGSRLLAFHRRHGIGGSDRNATPPVAPPPIAQQWLSPPSPRKPSIWDSELWALPMAAVAILVLWVALVVGGHAPVSAFGPGDDRPNLDAADEASTVEVAR